MQAPAPRIRLLWASLALASVFLVSACVATSTPRIRACAAGGGSPASEGTLRILPSTVPGVEIDSAYWRTGAGTEDIGAWEQLGYRSRLRAHRTVRRNELAIIHEPGDSAMTLDADVSVAARGRAGFVGGELRYPERIAERITYPAASVSGRTIPRVGEGQRVSDAGAVARERAANNERERERAADVLWTDSLRYFARLVREVRPGTFEHELTLVVPWRNPMTIPLYLPRCVRVGGPAYAIVRNATHEERSTFTPERACPDGIPALRVGPDSARVDTLHLRMVHTARPDWEQTEGPRAEGMFRLAIDVLTCDDGTPACRPPRADRLSRSRPFLVLLASM